ncbi:MAG TPA: 4Fe-4S double cluster binding domain-containing protein [Spirochaetota bacterium]|nr:4Fe-4S double cluster binding domain-containing protein [Spirochaetota bacterium]HRZ29006.1 4Fe-4S double cluster binding domain-containing protein [Spirochaetota bacterium]HSA15512.1 4Fe-4S double cluster binding domain-containing protein [Spirochaetota bacterium]
MKMNGKITRLLKSHLVDYIGFADITRYQDELARFGGEIVRGYKSAVSIGIAIPGSIVDHLPDRSDANVSCEYRTHGYEVLNQRLNLTASFLSSYLNNRNYRTLPIAVADRTDEENALPTVSHKMIAHIAGLGWIGKNCLLITRTHGPRVRFISVLTDAPLRTVDDPLPQECGECEECVKACPVGAIKGRNYVTGEEREDRLDFMKCQKYFEGLKKHRAYPVCGMCLQACPYGKRS